MPRQPSSGTSAALIGQPTVLAKPATSVTRVIGRRAARPYSTPSVAKAASYSPIAMPMPSTTQPTAQPHSPGRTPSSSRPSASSPAEASSTGRPPRCSIIRPTRGAARPEISSATEKAP